MDLLRTLVVLTLLLPVTLDSIQRSTECAIAIRLTDDATGGPADKERRPLAVASALEEERRPEADALVVAYRGAMGMDGNGGAAAV